MGGIVKRKSSPPPPPAAKPATAASKPQDAEPVAVLETAGSKKKRIRKGKRPLITGGAEVNVGGEGASGLNIPKG